MDELRRLAAVARSGDAPAQAALAAGLAPLARGAVRHAARYGRRLGLGAALDPADLLEQAQTTLRTLVETGDRQPELSLLSLALRLRARLRRYVQVHARRPSHSEYPTPPAPDPRPSVRSPGRALPGRQAQVLSECLRVEFDGPAPAGGEPTLSAALDRLSMRRRRLLYLFYCRRLSDGEIAAAMRLSLPAARRVRGRALAAAGAALSEADSRGGTAAG